MSRSVSLVTAFVAAAALVSLGGLVTHLTTRPPTSTPEVVASESAPATPSAEPSAEQVSRLEAREAEYRARLEEANRRLTQQGAALQDARRRLEGVSRPPRSPARRGGEREAEEDEHEHHHDAEHGEDRSPHYAWAMRRHHGHDDD